MVTGQPNCSPNSKTAYKKCQWLPIAAGQIERWEGSVFNPQAPQYATRNWKLLNDFPEGFKSLSHSAEGFDFTLSLTGEVEL